MYYPLTLLSLVLLALIHLTHGSKHAPQLHLHSHSHTISSSIKISNGAVPLSTRIYWMRRANSAPAELASPYPFAAFGAVIVNHTDNSGEGRGKLVCIGVNEGGVRGNPTLHGEIAAINNCSAILTDPEGEYRLSASEALSAFHQLSLYTNAESCPMCASAIRWSGFSEYIFGTSISTLIAKGWGQISISSEEIFEESDDLPTQTSLLGGVLANETDPYFLWQYNESYPCPEGCGRSSYGSSCVVDEESARRDL